MPSANREDSPPLRVTAAIVLRGSQVLIAKRKAGGPLGGLWEFPGGKVEPGETPEECLARELEEELGVAAEVGRFVTSSQFTYDDREIELLAYEVELGSGPFVLTSHDEVRWVSPAELLDLELAPADVPIARLLVSGGRSRGNAPR
jgi:8-oxo-dGTP diphosphatase